MRYRIANKKRFITFVTVVIVSLSGLFSLSFAKGEQAYTEVKVEEGDTLWSIAAEYGSPREDIRNTIYDIQKANSLDGALIYVGQVLLVPVD